MEGAMNVQKSIESVWKRIEAAEGEEVEKTLFRRSQSGARLAYLALPLSSSQTLGGSRPVRPVNARFVRPLRDAKRGSRSH